MAGARLGSDQDLDVNPARRRPIRVIERGAGRGSPPAGPPSTAPTATRVPFRETEFSISQQGCSIRRKLWGTVAFDVRQCAASHS
jgi:hypothetical protein